jgi:hypothetical protein
MIKPSAGGPSAGIPATGADAADALSWSGMRPPAQQIVAGTAKFEALPLVANDEIVPCVKVPAVL